MHRLVPTDFFSDSRKRGTDLDPRQKTKSKKDGWFNNNSQLRPHTDDRIECLKSPMDPIIAAKSFTLRSNLNRNQRKPR